MKRIDLIYYDAGGGHRAAANALKLVIEEQQRPWDVRLVNLQELLDPLDVFRKVLGRRLQDIYNLLLRKGWTLGSSQLCAMMHAIIRSTHPQQVRLIEEHWRASRPDLAVSLVQNFNRALRESLLNVCPAAPFVTVLTDLADYPPHFWIERQEQYLVCGTDRAVEQAKELGHAEDHIFRVSGMILHPRFYEPITVDVAAGRRRLGLDPARTTGLVMFGGEGAKVMSGILKELDGSGLNLQLIFICGRNEVLARKLREHRASVPMFVEGFTPEVPYYMHLSDFLIGKPGPGSLSEAMAMKLPVIVQCNAWTLPQERYNAVWVRQHQTGLVLSSFRRIRQAVRELTEPAALARYKANAAAIRNRAVFEVPGILERLLAAPPASAGSAPKGP
ncbi:MAG: galactosyldiacylglycerol synthase [Bryobacterales bacterium]|nr:galactosyldiacylglycerol synthase [Bryobacterales bacterium]